MSGATSSPADGSAGSGGPDPALFALEDVRLVLDGRCILDDLSVEIADGGITVLLGPSGAGKSMTLRLLNRLEVPTSGTVRFRGDDISSLDPLRLRRRVGMVFQRPAVFPGTVRENLLVAAPDASESELLACLAAADLDASFIDRLGDELSGGQAQRMCLARTLATEPEVLLMDEPTSALDPHARHRLEETARRLADDGRPMVWVTHDLDQADRLSDQRVVLVAGRLATGDEARTYLADADADTDAADTDGGGLRG